MVAPTERAIFNTFLPSTWRRKHIQSPKLVFFSLETTDNIHKFSHEYLLRQMCLFMHIATKIGRATRAQEISIFQANFLEDILQDTLGAGSTHRKASTYTVENKSTMISDMNQAVFEPTIPMFSSWRILHTQTRTPHGFEELKIGLPKIA